MRRLLKPVVIIALCGVSFFYGLMINLHSSDPVEEGMKNSLGFGSYDSVNSRKINNIPDNYLNEQIETVEDKRLYLPEKFASNFNLKGKMFNDNGGWMDVESPKMVSSMLYSFSPWVEKRVKKMFPDPRNENIFYANSPAIYWLNNTLLVVLRIWLVKERYEDKQNWPANYFKDNYFYMQQFDHKMRPVTAGELIGIPAAGAFTIGDGPIEPRLFKVNNRLLISYNTGMWFTWGMFDYTLIWDINKNVVIVPEIVGGSPMLSHVPKDDLPRDKHWSAFVDNNQLYFVQHLDPLRIMQCDLGETKARCKFVYSQDNPRKFIFDDLKHHFRGGTPFELYEYPYYIGISHVTLFKSSTTETRRFYTAHLIVLRVRPCYRIVYVSHMIKVSDEILNSVPIVRAKYIEDPFIFPVGLTIESPDAINIGVHISDYSSVILRLRGMRKLMKRVIRLDRSQVCTDRGPTANILQDFILQTVSNDTGQHFYESSARNQVDGQTSLDNKNTTKASET